MLEFLPTMQVIGGRYEVQDPPIGQGGMGVVYKAYDSVTKRFVALKTMWGVVDPTALELFEKEWTVLARLSHPNIVDILDTGEFTENGQRKPYFVMPLLPGLTLDKLIKAASQRLTVERTVEIMAQACRGLQAAHDQGLIHRDLKPSNIFVMDDDTVKIIDFGVVHLTDARTVTGIKGTLQYMAPEQLEMKPATPMSDLFSLGVVCYETLTGRKPFARKTEAEVVDAIRTHVPPPVSEISPAVNQLISRTVHKALAKQPYHRFSTVREFADTLQRSLRNEHIERFDRSKIQPRIDRTKKAFGEGDYQFAMEILTELESEGHIDPEMSLLRMQIEQAMRAKSVRQLLEGARTRMEEEEYPLALQKVQNVLDIDPTNVDALAIKSQIERQRSAKQIDNWFRLAQQHLDNQLFTQARQAAEEVLKMDATNRRARQFLSDVDRQEREVSKIREEKQKLYESALTSYKNGEISTALSKLEQVLDLSRSLSSNPQTDAQYQVLYNQIRSEREELHNAYSEGRKALDDRNFSKALQICNEQLSRRPGDPMFQALKIEVDEAQRQQQSAAIAEFNRRAEAEADLDRKLNILKEAAEKFPNEPLFVQSLKTIKDRRDLVNAIVTRARHYEENSQFNEAIGQWDILRNIYAQYPGVDFEVQRLTRRREEQAHEEAKARWVENIDRFMASGDYLRAGQTAQQALNEFPEDGELIRLHKLSEQALKKSEEARGLLEEGQRLCAAKNHPAGIEKLKQALQLDEKNPVSRAALLSGLVEYARTLVRTDWRAAEPFVREALRIDDTDPVAKSLSSLIADYKRREVVDRYVTEARDLQAEQNLGEALKKVEQALAEYPNEIRLSQLYGTLRAAVEAEKSETRRKQGESPSSAPTTVAPSPRVPAGPSQVPPGASRVPSDPLNDKPLPPMETIVQAPPPKPTPARVPPPKHAANSVPVAPPPVRAPAPPVVPTPALPPGGGIKPPGNGDGPPAKPVSTLPAPGEKKTPWAIIAGIVAVVVIAAAFIVSRFMGGDHKPVASPGPGSVSVKLVTNVAGTHFTLDGQPVASDTISLPPGSRHRAEAAADGYHSDAKEFTVSSGAQGAFSVQFDLAPALPQLRITSDLKAGKLVLDDRDTTDLQQGSFVKDDIQQGEHSLKILDNGKPVFRFSFKVSPKELIALTGPLLSNNTPGVVITTLGNKARVYATAGLKGAMGDQPPQVIPGEGLALDSVAGLEFVVTDGRNPQHIGLDTGSTPTLTVQLGAAPETGTLIVHSNVPDATLAIDGVLQKRGLVKGTRLLALKSKTYQIALSHDGYENVTQTVEIKKGEQRQISMNLTAVPSNSTVAIDGLAPEAEVIIDGKTNGATTASGNFTAELSPGKHNFKVHKPGYEDASFALTLQAGANKSTQLMNKLAAGTLSFRINPKDATITYRLEGTQEEHTAANGSDVTLKPGSYEISVVAKDHKQRVQMVPVTAGKPVLVDWTLEGPATQHEVHSIEAFEDPANWKFDKDTGGWYYHEIAGYSWLRKNEGAFRFAILKPGKSGFFKKQRVEWSVDRKDDQRIDYVLDNKQLRRRIVENGKEGPEAKFDLATGSQPYLILEVGITKDNVITKIDGKAVDTVKRSAPGSPLGKFGFKGPVSLTVR